MGKWAKNLFGRESFEDIGIIVGGTNPIEFEKEVLSLFDKVISSKDSVYHAHLVEKNNKAYPIVFNVYGAPAMMDVLAEMHDGGCTSVIFIGYAYGGFKNLSIGSIVVPNKTYHFDGIYGPIDPNKTYSLPDKELLKKVLEILKNNRTKYNIGPNISVPAVTFQLPHSNEKYQKIKPLSLEMEFSACCSRSKEIGIRTVSLLIIADNKSKAWGVHEKEKRKTVKYEILKLMINNLDNLRLPKLKVKKEFSIAEYLARVIEDPEDVTNVYRDRK